MDGSVRRSQFENFRTNLCEEAAIAGASGRRELRLNSGFFKDDLLHGADKSARRREERQATQNPLKAVFKTMPIEHRGQAFFQAFGRRFRTETEIEVHDAFAGDHIARACSRVDIAHLPTSRLKERI